MIDSKGLVCKSRLRELQHHKVNFAHDTGDMEWINEDLPLSLRLEGVLFTGVTVYLKEMFCLVWQDEASGTIQKVVVLCRLCVTPASRRLSGRTRSPHVRPSWHNYGSGMKVQKHVKQND